MMTKRVVRLTQSAVFTALAGLAAFNGADAGAATYTWVGTGDGDWKAAANWSPSGIPGNTAGVTDDSVLIDKSGTYVITYPDAAGGTGNASTLTNLTLNASGATLKMLSTATRPLYLTGDLKIEAGTLFISRGSTSTTIGPVALGQKYTDASVTATLSNQGVISIQPVTSNVPITMNFATFTNELTGSILLNTVDNDGIANSNVIFASVGAVTNKGTITIEAVNGGSTDFQLSDRTTDNAVAGTVKTLTNQGTINFSGVNGAKARSLTARLDNEATGIVTVAAGVTNSFIGQLSVPIEHVNSGTINLAATATLKVLGSNTLINETTGVVQGGGVLDANRTAGTTIFTNKGYLKPGGTGAVDTLTVIGGVNSASTAHIEIEIGASGSDLMKLTGAGTFALGGELNVSLLNGHTPLSTGIFDVVTATTITGTFTNVVDGRLLLGNGYGFDVLYFTDPAATDRVSLSNYSAVGVPEPAAAWMLGMGGLFILRRRRRSSVTS